MDKLVEIGFGQKAVDYKHSLKDFLSKSKNEQLK